MEVRTRGNVLWQYKALIGSLKTVWRLDLNMTAACILAQCCAKAADAGIDKLLSYYNVKYNVCIKEYLENIMNVLKNTRE